MYPPCLSLLLFCSSLIPLRAMLLVIDYRIISNAIGNTDGTVVVYRPRVAAILMCPAWFILFCWTLVLR